MPSSKPDPNTTTSLMITKYKAKADEMLAELQEAGIKGVKLQTLYSITLPAHSGGWYEEAMAIIREARERKRR